MENYAQILKWAAGGVENINPKVRYDESYLVNLIDLHSLTAKFLSRIKKEKAEWVTSKLIQKLKKLDISTQLAINKNIKALKELDNKLPNGKKIILIKGLSVFLLSNKPETLRHGDMDILSNDSNTTIKTLLNLGYKLTKAPFMHEIGEYSKNAVEFDIHNHFPVYAYSSSIKKTDFAKSIKPNSKIQNLGFVSKNIYYNDLYPDSIECAKIGLKNIKVVDPNLLAIIICGHSFMNFTNMWSISHRKKVYVRLGEISDLYFLTKHPEFDVDKFLNYCKKLNAWDSVNWVANMLMSLFGKNPLPVEVNISKGEPIPTSYFPRNIWWSFWSNVEANTDELLFPDWMKIDKLFIPTEFNVVRLNKHNTCSLNLDQLKKIFMLNKCLLNGKANIELLKGVLSIKLQVANSGYNYRGRLDFGIKAIEWEFDANNRKINLTGDKDIFTSNIKVNNLEYELTFRLNTSDINVDNSAKQLPLLLAIASYDKNSKINSSSLYPLKIFKAN